MQMINAYLYYLTPALAPAVAEAAGQGASFVGWLIALGTAGSIAFMLVGTPFVARLGPMRSLQLGTLLGGLGVLLFAVPSAASITLANVLMGLGYGPSSPAGSDILQRFAPSRHRNLIFSIRQAGVPLSGIAAGLLLPALYRSGGWPLVIASTFGLVLAAVLAVQPVRRLTDPVSPETHPIRLRQILSLSNAASPIRAVWEERLFGLSMAGACLAFGHGCWVAYLVTWLTSVAGLSLVDAGVVFAVMQATGVIGRLFLGWLSDAAGSSVNVLRTVAVVSALTSLFAALLGEYVPQGGLYVLAAVAGVSVSSWNGVQIAAVAARAPAERISMCASGATILVFSGFVVGPLMFAAMLQATASFGACFAMTAMATGAGYVFLPASRSPGPGIDRVP